MMEKYTIRKNNHYCFHMPKLYFGKKREFDIKFLLDRDCVYTLYGEDKYDINKLFGVSFGHHHRNSVRIGWNHKGGGIMSLYYYIYNDGARIYNTIGECRQHELKNINIKLDYENNKVFISSNLNVVEGESGDISFDFTFPSMKIGYYLFPYFGGNRTAPNDMSIYLGIN